MHAFTGVNISVNLSAPLLINKKTYLNVAKPRPLTSDNPFLLTKSSKSKVTVPAQILILIK